jgi:hypothetical protein
VSLRPPETGQDGFYVPASEMKLAHLFMARKVLKPTRRNENPKKYSNLLLIFLIKIWL